MDCSMLGFPVFHHLLEFAQTHVHWVSDTISSCHPLLLLPSNFPSIRVFSNESALHIRWPKYWSFSFTIGPSNEYSGLISFTIDWFALLAVQGTLKSLLHHSSKTSILWHSAFFMVQLSYPYMTTGKTIALTRWTFVGKVMSLLFIYLFYFTILYWFCHTLTWIRHGCTCVPHPEPPSHLPPHTIPLGHSITPGLAICFTYNNLHVSMSFSHIVPPSPSPTESKRLFNTSVSLLLSRIQGYCYHLSKFHIYAYLCLLICCLGWS